MCTKLRKKGILFDSHPKKKKALFPMTTIPDLSGILQDLFTTTANRLAKQHGFIQRQRKVTGAGFAQALVLGGVAQPDATRSQQQQAAVQAGMPLSVQGLEQRFTASAVRFLRALLAEGLTQMVGSEAACPILPVFNGVYLTDCTRLDWDAGGVKLAVRWELQRGHLYAHLSDLHVHDNRTPVMMHALPSGALHLGDLGFFQLTRFAAWTQQGVYWLTRFKTGTTVTHADGQPVDLYALLSATDHPVCLSVRVGQRERLPAYLVAAPVPETVLTQRLTRLQANARRKQQPVSAQQRAAAHWTIYLTNIPNLTFAQAHVLARTRWQIELLFKLWKSQGKVLTARTRDPLRQQCEGYAKLLGVLVAHWALLVSGWQPHTQRALDALRVARTHMPLLMRALRTPDLWTLWSDGLCHDLAQLARRSTRAKVPLTFQLWQAFDLVLP